MIKWTHGNLFESEAQTLVNAVNVVGVMGKGIALEFKTRYPEMFEEYCQLCRDGRLDIGKLHLYKADDHWVLNFPTKRHYRNRARLEYIEAGLRML
ncbi:MAG: macro domain-containing protein, partial [Chloroflexi bacterium]|nr:macro domain-containing protein [Chloroflexota bacterium]